MKKIILVIVLIAAAVVMSQTRPDKQAHKAAMMEAVKEYVNEEAASKGLGDNSLTRLGKNVVNKAIEAALGNKLELDDYILFNMTHVHMNDGDKTLSVGLLGHVFTFDKDMLRDALEESAREKAAAKEERAAAKAAEKELKKAEKELRKEQKRLEKEARKAKKRLEKEQKQK